MDRGLRASRATNDHTVQEIQKALDSLRARLAPASVNKRRTAFMDLWTTLDGRHQANPVKATDVYPEPEPEPRAPAIAAVLQLLKGPLRKTQYGKQCQARCAVITWTGWPHTIVKQIKPSDAHHHAEGRAFAPARRKGKGARARRVPLLPQAVASLKRFHRVRAHGHFSNSSLHKRVTQFCDSKKIERIRPYDLRHFFGTLIATLTTDERVIMELLLVSTPKIVRRYTDAATDPRVQAAVKGIARKLPNLLRAAEPKRRRRAGRIGRKGRTFVGRIRSKTSERVRRIA
jgi:integrase